MRVEKEEGAAPVKIWASELESEALQQAKNIARLPFIPKQGIALMPDAHAGIGSTVGSVIPTDKAIIPAAVGVDIGCGMNAVRLALRADQLPDSLLTIRHQIERDIPLGTGGAHRREDEIEPARRWLGASFFNDDNVSALKAVTDAVGEERTLVQKAASQLGTLGSGNHFIELCIDENQDVWIMLHSGSRGVGNIIGRHYIERAKRNMEKFFITLPDADLAYFPEGTDDFDAYVKAVQWAQDYAMENRRVMMDRVYKALCRHLRFSPAVTQEAINCHHNYVEKENHFGRNLWVTRKGAIRAREGELGIIPGSMGQRSYIVRGKGNPDSYCSCSHGAGRRMSRIEARRRYKIADLVRLTEGVECRKDDAVLDEIPAAYKDIDQVMQDQANLIEVVHVLKQVLCVKGA
jgi:tRNA-splicing ligase RtcB (3'-phosphate/5'-hydroxy nucleic acid ligase)